jgi:hypothetical protein
MRIRVRIRVRVRVRARVRVCNYYFVLFVLYRSKTSYEKLVYKNSIIRRPLRLTVAR